MSTEPEPENSETADTSDRPDRGGARYRAGRPKRTGWRRVVNWKVFGFTVLGMFLLGAGAIGVAFAMIDVPEPNDFSTSESTIVYWDDGETELGRFSAENREIVGIEEIPETLQQAVVAAEDRTFYENDGFSVTGMLRAGWDSLSGSASAGGGSTITQQYVKNYYLTQDRSYTRKLRELVISVKIDQDVDKDQILGDYLNTIWFGRGTYGVQTASRSYFGVDVADLDLAQSAALAAILRSPTRYDPTLGPENAERFAQRFQYVIDGMVTTGAIDQATADATVPPEVLPEQQVNRYGGPNGYLLMMVRDELLAMGYDEQEIETGGLRVTSTFNTQAQSAAIQAIQDERPTEDADGVHIGLAAVRPGDGAVVAVYGGPDAVEQSYNDAVDAIPQAGSTVKPFVLAAGLEDGYSLRSTFWGNSPFDPPELGPPVNNQGNEDYGRNVSLERAMESSVNTAFVDLAMEMGPEKVVDSLVRAGFPDDEQLSANLNPRVAIGIGGVSALNMANSYATLASQGLHSDTTTIQQIVDRDGAVTHELQAAGERVFEEDVTADVTYALTETVDGGTAEVARDLDRPVAAKTGTHDDLTAWFSGYTPQLAASVVYFRGDGTESLDGVGGMDHFSGGAYPGRTWTAFMDAALEGMPEEDFPDAANIREENDNDDNDSGNDNSNRPDDDDEDENDNGDEGGQGDENGEEPPPSDENGAEPPPSDENGGDETGGDESGATESGTETGGDESGATESGTETGGDESGAAEEGTEWGGTDTGGTESGTDAGGTESGTDTGGTESGTESGAESGTDSGTDTGAESGTPAPGAPAGQAVAVLVLGAGALVTGRISRRRR
ncbi:transglycosylase domain-containing protein [Jiangella alkaliphila]|uniref:Membrane carboxypeptidase (Penicillin-binding protein) n=1 Tax=Jiangella alkaliphila TaxID=419479 RepID=A0A1H2GM84_9ACTN|nr:transglycosylase domain-containing protein [Jiangella alkaliphila]SDU20695.1 Membrane carboxypeptidase (penicillin-binding protein) [Jiangella alkaliphila]